MPDPDDPAIGNSDGGTSDNASGGRRRGDFGAGDFAGRIWAARADVAQAALVARFWDPRAGLFWLDDRRVPRSLRRHAPYWWQAQALAAQLDAAGRVPRAGRRALELLAGIARMAGSLTGPDFYDDLAWLGLACVRAHDLGWVDRTPARQLLAAVRVGADPAGGMRWKRADDFHNVPATAPAGLLALGVARWDDDPWLVGWATRLAAWLHAHLVSPSSGLIWDGSRSRAGVLVAEGPLWSYNVGTVAGLDLALADATPDPDQARRLRERASRTIRVGTAALRAGAVAVEPGSVAPAPAAGLWRDEGPGDPALFRGILARYVADLVCVDPTGAADVRADLLMQAAAVWEASTLGLVEHAWGGATPPARQAGPVSSAEQLTAVLVLEAAARVAGSGGCPR